MPEGLRERSRTRRRAAIARAALQLFADRGYDETTVAQVADAAEVSARTVSLYFPAKLDLALAYVADSAERLSALCLGREAHVSTQSVLSQWLDDEYRHHAESITLLRRMLHTNPALRGAETPGIAAARQRVSIELAADLGRRPDDSLVLLVNGALAGIISAFIQIDPDADSDSDRLAAANSLMQAVIDSAQVIGVHP